MRARPGMTLPQRTRRMWERLKRFLRRPRRRAMQRPPPDPLHAGPPLLSPAQDKYILYRCGDGAFDVYDGAQMIGDLYRQDRSDDGTNFWIATLYNAHFDRFTTLKAAKDWLGSPPVRKYRRSESRQPKQRQPTPKPGTPSPTLTPSPRSKP